MFETKSLLSSGPANCAPVVASRGAGKPLSNVRYPVSSLGLRGWSASTNLISSKLGTVSSVACCAKSSDTGKNSLRRSFDSDEDLDAGLAADLATAADPDRLKKLAKHFDLAWKIRKPSRPEVCKTCTGTGEHECAWCHGTGYLMVGDQLISSTSNHTSNCPVCKGKGYCKCEKCVGTGFRAKWLSSTDGPLP